MVVLLAGGGSGGHIYPLVAVCEQVRILASSKNIEVDFHYLGRIDPFSIVLANSQEVKMHSIPTSKLRRYFSLSNILDIPKFFLGLFQAWFKVFWIMPDVIFSKGGSGALPVILAGWFYRVPIIIHESDSVPGLSNVVSSRFAKKIAVSFEKTLTYFDSRKCMLTGNPVRADLLGERYLNEVVKEQLNFNEDEPLILILGGSQGSKRMNDFVLANLQKILEVTQVLHQTGPDNFLEVQKLSRAALIEMPIKAELEHRYKALPYLDQELKTALMAADLVVARAGSGTIFEIAAFGKPAILIPLHGSAQDHQRINAFEFARAGGGVVIEEENLMINIFIHQLKEILGDSKKSEMMSKASLIFFKPKASEIIAQEILNLAGFRE